MSSLNLIIKRVKSFFSSIFSFILNTISKVLLFLKIRKNPIPSFDNGQKQAELDKKLVFSLSKARIPSFKQLKYLGNYLTNKERWIMRACFLAIILSLLAGGAGFYFNHLQIVPARGGKYVEGLIGAPKNINPLYATINDVDNDISHLIYSSLFKRNKNGELVKDLVENYEISDDSKVYTFTLKPDVLWHDDSVLTVDDVFFTFNAIKDPQYKSPLRNSYFGVTAERVDENKIRFILTDPYAAFLGLMTFGILPADLWSQIPPESASLAGLNLKPLGTGPFKFDNLVKDEKTGAIKEYNLIANEKYYGNHSMIDIGFRFYSSFKEAVAAMNNNIINGISYLPHEYKSGIITPKTLNLHKLYLPQLTLIFLNQKNNSALGDRSTRQALIYSIDRNKIITDILAGDAYAVNGPILPNSFAYHEDINKYEYNPKKADQLLNNIDWRLDEITEETIKEAEENIKSDDEKTKEKAEIILSLGRGKWRKKDGNYLAIRLTTVMRKENQAIVESVGDYWKAIGVKAEIEILPAKRIRAEVIKPKNFEALFYGQILGADPDPYAFWHSSQTREGGYNIANYANKETDQLLEDARLISDKNRRREKYKKFQEIISEDSPALFMYSPIYTYVQDKKINGFDVQNILFPYDRLSNINEWYIKTGRKLIW